MKAKAKKAAKKRGEESCEEEEVSEFLLGPRETAVISIRNFAVSLVTALLISSAAHAASVTNRDARDHKVTVIEGNAQNDHVLKPYAALEGICQKGCVIRLNDNEEDPYELKGSEVTSIEDGQLYDDELEAPACARRLVMRTSLLNPAHSRKRAPR